MNTSFAHDVSLHDPDSHWPADSPPHAAADPADREREDTSPAGAEAMAGRGRPSTCTPAKLQAICSFIRLTGLSDTAAAAMAGVKRSTLARWKQEDDEVELMLDQARFQYQAPRLARIDEARLKNGELDWRAQSWLVKHANPEVYGTPSRRRKLREVELSPEEQHEKECEEAGENWQELWKDSEKYFQSGRVITPAMLAMLQQRRAIALRDDEQPAGAEGSAEADAPAQNARTEDGPAQNVAAASPESGAGAAKSVTIRPEIHGLYRDPGAWARPAASGAPPPAMGAPRRTAAMAG